MFIMPSFKTSLIVEQFQGNYLKSYLSLNKVPYVAATLPERKDQVHVCLDDILFQNHLLNEAFSRNKFIKLNFYLHKQLSILFKFLRKKKKNKAKKVLEEVSHSVSKGGSDESQKQAVAEDTRTPAQIAYDKIQEKRVCADVNLINKCFQKTVLRKHARWLVKNRVCIKEIENTYSVILSSYTNTRESLGELKKAVETLACSLFFHSISCSPKLPLVFVFNNYSPEAKWIWSNNYSTIIIWLFDNIHWAWGEYLF